MQANVTTVVGGQGAQGGGIWSWLGFGGSSGSGEVKNAAADVANAQDAHSQPIPVDSMAAEQQAALMKSVHETRNLLEQSVHLPSIDSADSVQTETVVIEKAKFDEIQRKLAALEEKTKSPNLFAPVAAFYSNMAPKVASGTTSAVSGARQALPVVFRVGFALFALYALNQKVSEASTANPENLMDAVSETDRMLIVSALLGVAMLLGGYVYSGGQKVVSGVGSLASGAISLLTRKKAVVPATSVQQPAQTPVATTLVVEEIKPADAKKAD